MAKKAAPKSSAKAAPKSAPSSSRPKTLTKAEICTSIGEKTGLSQKQVASVFDGLNALIGKDLGKKGPGQFIVPGLLKLKVVRKAATKAKPGINPFTKEPITIAAKPARNVVRGIPMKALKDMV